MPRIECEMAANEWEVFDFCRECYPGVRDHLKAHAPDVTHFGSPHEPYSKGSTRCQKCSQRLEDADN